MYSSVLCTEAHAYMHIIILESEGNAHISGVEINFVL